MSVGLPCLVGRLIEVMWMSKHKWGDNGILQPKTGKILSAEQVKTAVAHENMCLQCFEYIEYKVKHGDGYVYWFCDKNLFM